MLKQFRTQHVKTILWILIITIVPSFVLWGVSSLQKSKREKNAAFKLDGRLIGYSEYSEFIKTAQIYYRLNMGNDFFDKATQALVETKALEFMLFSWKAKKENITVSDEEVVTAIKNIFSIDGTFDNELYKQRIGFLGITPRSFEEHVRIILTADKIMDTFVRNPEVSDEEVRNLYRKENERVKLKSVSITADTLKVPDPSEGELRDFFEKHKAEFNKQPTVRLTYIVLDKDEALADMGKIIRESAASESLTKVAEKLSLTVKTTPLIRRDETLPDEPAWDIKINELAFSMPLNIISAPVDTGTTYVIFEKIEEQPGVEAAFETIKEALKEKMLKTRKDTLALETAQKIIENVSGDTQKTLDTAAGEAGFSTRETDVLTYAQIPAALGIKESVTEWLLDLPEGKTARHPFMTDSGYVLLEVTGREAIDEDTFARKKDLYRSKISGNKVFSKYLEFISTLQQEAHLTQIQ